MPIYSYTAKNQQGNSIQGSVDARTSALAVSLLRDQGLFVVSIGEKRSGIMEQLANFRGVPLNDVVTFTRQFSTMISAGLPISRALEVLGSQTPNASFKKIINDILRSVEGGSSLSSAMSMYPDIFNTTYEALVRAGESSGKLDTILKKLADNMEADREITSKLKSAMIYPTIIVIAMIGVFVILMIFVIPNLADMYEAMDVELPLVTRAMMITSRFMVKYFYIVAIVGFLLVFAARSFIKSDDGKVILSQLSHKMPVFGKVTNQKDFAQFSRTLSLLINSAVPIVDSLQIVSTVISGQDFKKSIIEARVQVEKGTALSTYFRSDKRFPPLLSQMAGVGEETGKMDEVLERVAVYYEGEVEHLVKGLSSAMEPIILVMLGGMVGFLILSVIMPIYNITTSI